jgi:hypothetical protein
MSKKRGKMNFNPDNPNKLEKEIKDISKQPTKEQIAEYKRLRKNVMAKARRLKTAKNRDAWIALGGLEIEEAEKQGRRINTNLVHPYLNAKNQLLSNPSKLMDKKELQKTIDKMKKFTTRGGELEEIQKSKDRIIKSIINVGYNSPDLDDVVRYIKEMPLSTFGQLFTVEEAYNTIEDVYLEDDDLDYLDRFKSYSGYYAQTGEETEKQWSKRFKQRYGRDVRL